LPCSEPKDVRSLTRGEIWALRDSCRGDWLAEFVELALATGCRRGELLALEWADINWAARTISISKSLEQTRAGLRLKSTKGGKPRVFSLPRIAIDSLVEQKATGHARLIFADDHGGYLKPDLVSQLIVRRIRKAGIDDASLHSLRHAHASQLLSRGVPLPAVAARLGHSNPNTTARIYCHALPLDDQRASNEWDRMFGAEDKEADEREAMEMRDRRRGSSTPRALLHPEELPGPTEEESDMEQARR
jgi:integrase